METLEILCLNKTLKLESEKILYEKRKIDNVLKTVISAKINALNKPEDEILRLDYYEIKKISINDYIVENNINLDFKISSFYISNQSCINQLEEQGYIYLNIVIEYSKVA